MLFNNTEITAINKETEYSQGAWRFSYLPQNSFLVLLSIQLFFSSFTDIDECSEQTHNCHEVYGVCTNQAPFFLCTCALGSKGNGTYCVG